LKVGKLFSQKKEKKSHAGLSDGSLYLLAKGNMRQGKLVKPNFQSFTEEALIQQFSAREREQPKSAFDAKCGADVLVVHLMLCIPPPKKKTKKTGKCASS
jgi:hypothetical protein